MVAPIKWVYGVTTLPSRANELLPKTLSSLSRAGFDRPRLFIDDCKASQVEWYQRRFGGLDVTTRYPRIYTYGNWILALGELFIREPTGDRYAIFQDDFVTVKNLKAYLTKCPYPKKGYFNLYTFPSNQQICPKCDDTGEERKGWYRSNQLGKGAVALVFSREAVLTLLSSQVIVERPMSVDRGKKAVDGGIVTAMTRVGWTEYVHNPSLVQHTGLFSSMNNKPHKLAVSFPGEDYNALDLLVNDKPIEDKELNISG